MKSITTKQDSSQPVADTAVYLFDDWFDPIEAVVRDRVRGFIQAMIEGELGVTLERPRYGRRPQSSSSASDGRVDPRGGTDTGAHVKETLSAHAREAQAAMRSSREAGLKVMHTLTQNYATLVSGVLIGLSEALEHGKPKTKH